MNVLALKTKLLYVCSKSCVPASLLTLNYPVSQCGTEIASVRNSLRSGIKVNGTNRLRKVVAWLQQIAAAAATIQRSERNMCERSTLFVPYQVQLYKIWPDFAALLWTQFLDIRRGTGTGTYDVSMNIGSDIDYVFLILILMYLLTAIGLSPGGRSTLHIYTQIILRTIQSKQYIEQHNNCGRVRAVPHLG